MREDESVICRGCHEVCWLVPVRGAGYPHFYCLRCHILWVSYFGAVTECPYPNHKTEARAKAGKVTPGVQVSAEGRYA